MLRIDVSLSQQYLDRVSVVEFLRRLFRLPWCRSTSRKSTKHIHDPRSKNPRSSPLHLCFRYLLSLHVYLFFSPHSYGFEALFVKSWRICRLYYNKTVEIIRISDRKIWVLIGLLVLIELLFLIIFSSVSDVEAEVEQPELYRPSYNFTGKSKSNHRPNPDHTGS